MKRVVIVAGGRLGPWASDLIRRDDFLIGADYGAVFLVQNGFRPDIAVGDFDSASPEEVQAVRAASARFVSCDPVMKDDTDTEMAFRLALAEKPDAIWVLGALGTRFDHSLANVHLLTIARKHGVECRLVDEFNEIRLMDGRMTVDNPGGKYAYVSLLPLTMEVEGITLTGFRYPLTNHTARLGETLTLSNQLAAPEGIVEIRSGLLLVIQSRD